jgi:hypothetical protein
MTRLTLLPLFALALAACSDPTTTTGPVPGPGPRLATTTTDQNAPNGTHLQRGTPGCTTDGLTVSCASYELAGVGNADAQATLVVSWTAIVDCRNRGGKVVPVKSQVEGAEASTGEIEPKNGRLAVPALSSGAAPSDDDFTDSATCPNGNWTKEVQAGSAAISGFTYALTFTGFGAPYITITG